MKNAKTFASLAGTVFAARTALARVREVREDGDKLELVDAVLNIVVLVTGTIVIVRRLRKGRAA